MKKRLFALVISFSLLISMPALAVPRGVYYEVFVRSFADSNGDGIGDLNGLSQKLDYLSGLGVKGMWLMPIFPSPSYHGYDITDYRSINPEYGTMADFRALLEAAHEKGMSILLDIAFNHTSTEHPWFLKSMDIHSPMRDWYRWLKPEGTAPGKAWHPAEDGWYYFGFFSQDMPDLNFDTQAVRDEVISIGQYWLTMGVDGFRLDATSHIYASGETGLAQDTAKSAEWWAEFRAAMKKSHPDCYLLGEAWEAMERRAVLLKGLDATLNFDVGEDIISLLKSGGSGKLYVQKLEKMYGAYALSQPEYIDAPFLTNHDQNRLYGMVWTKLERAKMAAAMLLTLPGNPVIYYGEEIGMMGAKPDEQLRTPMIWGDSDPLMTSWIVSKYNKRTWSVSDQEADPQSLLACYKALIALRSSHPALLTGTLVAFDAGNEGLAAYTLTGGGETLYVLHNFTAGGEAAAIPEGLKTVYQSTEMIVEAGRVTLPAYSTLILGK